MALIRSAAAALRQQTNSIMGVVSSDDNDDPSTSIVTHPTPPTTSCCNDDNAGEVFGRPHSKYAMSYTTERQYDFQGCLTYAADHDPTIFASSPLPRPPMRVIVLHYANASTQTRNGALVLHIDDHYQYGHNKYEYQEGRAEQHAICERDWSTTKGERLVDDQGWQYTIVRY